MAKNLLTASQIKSATCRADGRPKKHNDGEGLYLKVFKSGAKSFRYDFKFTGKYQTLVYGSYPELSLSEVRELHREALKLKGQGINPAEQKQKEKYKVDKASFQIVADEWYQHDYDRKAKRTVEKRAYYLKEYINPFIGNKAINEVEPPEILYLLRKIEKAGKISTAHRVKTTISQILRYAVATGRCKRDVTLDLRGALKPIITRHRSAITDPKEIGELLRALADYQGDVTTRYALKILPYVFVRMGEFRTMEWQDLDLDNKQWLIPAEKMKMKSPHIVPLCEQVIQLLKALHEYTSYSTYVFPSIRTKTRPMSENTVNASLRRLGYTADKMCSHGFRSMASTRLNELGFRADVIERQLAHIDGNKVRSAYNRSEYIEERTNMMQSYADYLDTLRDGATVIPINRRKA